jgi:protein-disulfide isomerase
MGRPKQNLPRTFRQPQPAQADKRSQSTKHITAWARIATSTLLVAVVTLAALTVLGHTSSRAAAESRVDSEVSTLLAGIPQHANTLGNPTAPITLQIFIDLKDPDCRDWFLTKLPAIIHDFVRTGALKLEYHAYKTNTFRPQVFVKEQTAALAAGTQNKLWNYIDTFYYEQKSEFIAYVNDTHLANIAHQIPNLNLTRWYTDLHTERREERTTQEDQTARALHLYVTPSFRIGKTGGPMHNFSGVHLIKYPGQPHPIALPEASDIGKAIQELDSR